MSKIALAFSQTKMGVHATTVLAETVLAETTGLANKLSEATTNLEEN